MSKAPCGCKMIPGFGKTLSPTCETEVGPCPECKKLAIQRSIDEERQRGTDQD